MISQSPGKMNDDTLWRGKISEIKVTSHGLIQFISLNRLIYDLSRVFADVMKS